MTIQEYFGDWCKVIDITEADRIMKKLVGQRAQVCPSIKDIFKAFTLCKLHDLKVVIIGSEPYCDIYKGRPRATGIAFANSNDVSQENFSSSLDVLMESVINYTLPHGSVIFDPSLEKWEKQGVLLISAALSCLSGKPGSHTALWKPFMKSFLTNLSKYDTGIVYVLMGDEAQSLEPCINPRYNHIIKTKHPLWYARNHTIMPSDLWYQINKLLIGHYGFGVDWYKEYKFLIKQNNEEVFYEGNRG